MKTYRPWLIVRLLILLLTMAAIVWVAVEEGFIGLTVLLSLAAAVQVWLLFRFLDRSDQLLKRFFESVAYDDFTARFSHKRSVPFTGLEASLEKVMDQFRNIRAEKEEGYLYLESVIHHLSIPTLTVRDDEFIHFSNPAAKRLFDKPRLSRLVDLGQELPELLRELGHGEKRAFRHHRDSEVIPLLVSVTRFHLRDHHYLLASFQDIRREVEKAETEAWQRLTRVLRHEILNSLTPVTTLAHTLGHMIFMPGTQEVRRQEEIQQRNHDIKEAIGLIQKRSEGLMNFVQTYREVTRPPLPQWEQVAICPLLTDICQLFFRRFSESGIALTSSCFPEDMMVEADPSLLEQVLINLVLNAREAIGESGGKIQLAATMNSKNQIELSVTDSGPGIPAEIVPEIFTPFFTTKAEGSGIGLSVSRQILLAHGGELLLIQDKNTGTRFVMRLGRS